MSSGTPISENHRRSCHRAHPGVRHGEWERERRRQDAPRSVPSPRHWTRAVVGDDIYLDLLDTIDPGDDEL